jgi:hypothetical protein
MSDATPGSSTPVDTAELSARRVLHFDSLDEMLAEVDRLVEAERHGSLKRLGNWTLGQTLGHLASWTEYGYDGYPPLRVPFFIRWMLRLLKRTYCTSPCGPAPRFRACREARWRPIRCRWTRRWPAFAA